jgi:hypothetical protein
MLLVILAVAVAYWFPIRRVDEPLGRHSVRSVARHGGR